MLRKEERRFIAVFERGRKKNINDHIVFMKGEKKVVMEGNIEEYPSFLVHAVAQNEIKFLEIFCINLRILTSV